MPSLHRPVPCGIRADGSGVPETPTPAANAVLRRREASDLRVLLVEDNPVNLLVATRMLSRLGLSPDVCTDGYQAVERTAAQAYDLILMDLQMPNMDGLEATYRIRAQQPSDRRARIAALTANTTEQTRKDCVAAGMDAFLGKPFTLEDLARMLASLFPARGLQ